MHILVDMDGVIANWGKQWDHVLDTHWPEARAPRHHQQTSFDLKAGLDAYDRDVVDMVMNHPNFYRDLDPFEGAAQAITNMQADGHTVTICTSPWLSNKTCVADKLEWLERHIGEGWSSKAVITGDKTLVHGDILIDDKPHIKGAHTPTWEHVLFDQPYNRDVANKQRITGWANWSTQILGVRA